MGDIFIKLISCESGDWHVLSSSEGFEYSGHSIPDYVWLDLIKELGFNTEKKEISDEDMENENY